MYSLNSFDPRSFNPISWAPADEWHVDPLELHQSFLAAMLDAADTQRSVISSQRRVFKGKSKNAPASLLDVDPGQIIAIDGLVITEALGAPETGLISTERRQQNEDDLALTLILLEATA